MNNRVIATLIWLLLVLLVSTTASLAGGGEEGEHGEKTSRISDDSVPVIDPDAFPKRPRPLVELGNKYLGTGEISPGFELPTGAVWQPSLMVYGAFRTAVQSFDSGAGTLTEWANRLELFTNLQLSGTERLLIGFRPLEEEGRFSGYTFDGPSEGWDDNFDANVTSFFFEGDLGEIFPNADRHDRRRFDWGFAVGRQPFQYQDGLLLNDEIDAIGFTRNTILPRGGTNLQMTYLYGWGNVHRDDNVLDRDAQILGVLTAADYPTSTWNGELFYVFNTRDDNDGLYAGLSAVQRFGHTNSTFHILASRALDQETSAVSDGVLLFSQLSWTLPWGHDLVYLNTFWGIDQFSSAARGPATGGPLGRAGVLFAAVGLGRYGAALGNRADDSAGAAVGWQMFARGTRRQIILELGGRQSTAGVDDGTLALGARFQQAIGRRYVLQFDAFGSVREQQDNAWGARTEFRIVF